MVAEDLAQMTFWTSMVSQDEGWDATVLVDETWETIRGVGGTVIFALDMPPWIFEAMPTESLPAPDLFEVAPLGPIEPNQWLTMMPEGYQEPIDTGVIWLWWLYDEYSSEFTVGLRFTEDEVRWLKLAHEIPLDPDLVLGTSTTEGFLSWAVSFPDAPRHPGYDYEDPECAEHSEYDAEAAQEFREDIHDMHVEGDLVSCEVMDTLDSVGEVSVTMAVGAAIGGVIGVWNSTTLTPHQKLATVTASTLVGFLSGPASAAWERAIHPLGNECGACGTDDDPVAGRDVVIVETNPQLPTGSAHAYCATESAQYILEEVHGQDAEAPGGHPVYNAGQDCDPEDDEDEGQTDNNGSGDDVGPPYEPCADIPGQDCDELDPSEDDPRSDRWADGDDNEGNGNGNVGGGGGGGGLGDCNQLATVEYEESPLDCEAAGCVTTIVYPWDSNDDGIIDNEDDDCTGILYDCSVAQNGDACGCGYAKCEGGLRTIYQ